MDQNDLDTLKNCTDFSKSCKILESFVFKHCDIFDLKVFDECGAIGQWPTLWNITIDLMQQSNGNKLSNETLILLLSALRILSRNKTYLDQTITNEHFQYLLNVANIGGGGGGGDDGDDGDDGGKNNIKFTNAVAMTEALKCICNLVYQSVNCQRWCLTNGAIQGILERLRYSKLNDIDFTLQFYDMKLLFLITALNVEARQIGRDQGLIDVIDHFELQLQDTAPMNAKRTSSERIDLFIETLKALFNLTLNNETDDDENNTNDDDDEADADDANNEDNSIINNNNNKNGTMSKLTYKRLATILRQLLLYKCVPKEKRNVLLPNTVNLLNNIPIEYYSELVVVEDHEEDHEDDVDDNQEIDNETERIRTDDDNNSIEIIKFNGMNVSAIDVLLTFLKCRLLKQVSVGSQQELLSPVLTALVKSVRCNSIQRRYVRSVILPPLKDFKTRPEVGDELRNYLCRLLTTPSTQVRDLSAELLFVICKESVSRVIKYIGYGNAAGLFANRGLLDGGSGGRSIYNRQNKTRRRYSTDSEDSDTEEYKQLQHDINPVLGCYEPPRPNPFDGMTDEQKEYEAIKLVNLMEQLNRQGIVQPCRIGTNGRPEPVEHILQLQDGIPNQQVDRKKKN